MTTPAEFLDVADQLMRLNQELRDLDGNPYLRAFSTATSTQAWFDVVLDLDYGASSKVLRDTDDPRVHQMLDRIGEKIDEVRAIFTAKLAPVSPGQLQSWRHAGARNPPLGPHAFRDDGSLDACLLYCSLRKSILHVGRVLNGGNYTGFPVDLELKLVDAQACEVGARLSDMRAICAAYDSILPERCR